MAPLPPLNVQRAFLQPTVNVVRRVEIYEEDGKTAWRRDLWKSLLVGGNVSIDYDRDERRTLDINLDNSERELSPKAGGLWYDKVFKVFYGVKVGDKGRPVRVAVVEQYVADGQAFALKEALSTKGITEIHYVPTVTSLKQVQEYDVIVAISSSALQKVALLTECYNAGKSVISFSMNQTAASLPLLVGNAGTGTVVPDDVATVEHVAATHDLSLGWDSWSIDDPTPYRKVLNPAAGAITVAKRTDEEGESIAVVARRDFANASWIHVVQSEFKEEEFETPEDYADFAGFAAGAVRWASTYQAFDIWEQQIGEFLADSIADGDNYAQIRVTGRDYTKRCMNSKFGISTTFVAATPIETVIKAVASNAGVLKLRIPATSKVLDKDTTWERGTSRWEVIKTVANANNYELYFDHEGYLVMREFLDPLLTPPTLILSAGVGGNLVSRGAKTSDARLFNHIVVVGESSDSQVPPSFAEAINTAPGSFTSVKEIGDRVDVISSPLVTDVSQAQDLANSLLAVSALEEFELSFECTLLPWIESGDILDMAESDDRYWGPDRFLLTSLSLPLDLSPMSGNGKRVTKVGSDG